ncbi:hypothetical protein [Priestia aryabhattai]
MDNTFEINTNEKKFKKPSEVAEGFEMPESTLRKYSRVLEEAGHTFRKGEKKMRLYSPTDELILYKMIKRIKEHEDSLSKAAAFAIDGQALEESDTELTQHVSVQSKDVQSNDLAPILEKTLNELFHLKKHIIDNTVSKNEFNDLAKLTRQVLDETVEVKKAQQEKDDEIAALKEQLLTTQQQYAYTQEKFDRVINMIEREERENTHKKKGFLSKFFGS